MEGDLQGGSNHVAALHVKTEAVDENASALLLGRQESPAPCGDTACRGGGGEQTAEELADTELQAATTTTPVLLYPVSTERFFTTSGDGKTYLKIAPASVMPPAPSEKTLCSGSDFSSKAVLCLIEAVGRRWGLYETRERSQLFQSVQEEMASKGHILPVEKIRRKWNNLIVTYKRVKDRSRETGHAKTSWEFFDLMDATLCDTIGTQIVNNKRNKGGSTVSLISASNTDLNTLGYTSRKAPSISSGVIPFRLSTTSLTQSQNLLGLSSSFPLTSSCLTSSAATSLSTSTVSGTEGQNQKAKAEQGGSTLFQEILKRQEEQAYLDRVARRRVEAREKRRERREVRMSESLGRIATALELLSSKQDTVIALLQRLADRK
ncbi:uncharacterized protein LOC106632447 isoform X2 [Haplochromis burtoni]|uniref:uncharacterized protein LOC106632447 isoform X2 n=1 Tax=Haplochromis burtoni TaxID=8153 RepID=UPI001C2D5331|nr:uncharacterized protein LOC106632447 isoform X2 [Haplochromis burtoni]